MDRICILYGAMDNGCKRILVLLLGFNLKETDRLALNILGRKQKGTVIEFLIDHTVHLCFHTFHREMYVRLLQL